jgi:site-specific DNA recombinase
VLTHYRRQGRLRVPPSGLPCRRRPVPPGRGGTALGFPQGCLARPAPRDRDAGHTVARLRAHGAELLLADPALIRAEIGKRLERARTSDPVTRKRGQLEQALAKTAASIAAMITAFSEQLITIDELRTRMPNLRARETGLKDQIAALDAQAADRDAYLRLAEGLEGFLSRLRENSATASVEDRQRVLRALFQDILIGPGKLTIRHRIPAREPSGGGGHDSTDTEDDMRNSSLLRWGRDFTDMGFKSPSDTS